MLDKIFTFAKKHNRWILGILLISILISSVCLTNLESELEETVKHKISAAEFETMGFQGYTIAADEQGRRVYTAVGADPWIFVTVNTESVNKVTVNFASLKEFGLFQMYYASDYQDFVEANSRFGGVSGDGRSASVSFPDTALTSIRLDLSGIFSVESIEFSHVVASAPERVLSRTALVVLIVSITLLAVVLIFEKQFGCVALIFGAVLARFDYFKMLIKERRILRFALRILLYLLALTFGIMLAVLTASSKYSIGVAIIVFYIALALAAVYLLDSFLSGNAKPAVMFLVLTLIVGITITYLKAPAIGGGWDEAIHYMNTVNLKIKLFGGSWSAVDSNLAKSVYYYNIYNQRGDSYFADMILESGMDGSTHTGTISLIFTVAYLPSAIVMGITEALGADIIKMLFMEKAINVVVYAAVLYLALRRLKSGALMFSSVAMLPTAIFMSSTVNYDSWLIAFVGFSFIYYISLLQDKEKKIRIRDWVAVLGSFTVGCLAKTVYFFLSLPYIFVPKEKFESKKQARIFRIAAAANMLLVALLMLVPFFVDTGAMSDNRGGEGVDAGGQLAFIFGNILTYAKILIEFLLEYVSFARAVVYSTAMEPFSTSVSPIAGTLAIVLILFTALLDRDECDDFVGYKRLKATSVIAFAGTLALVATALYISFTPVGSASIGGCQYRYMIPAVFPLAYALSSRRIKCSIPKIKLAHLVFALLAAVAFISSYDVFIKSWLWWVENEGGVLPF